ncbi:MAG TPA: U32 family peptidase [Syntrophomonadaceae bacterium]|nr:U32 family peptidase [Syntrophomonadaceae bacterium]
MPELVLPGGNLEKLKTAAAFGADAVYFGGKDFSLRAYAGNFELREMAAAITYLHQMNKKAYITVNITAHNRDLALLPAYLEGLASLQPDALIISDPGVMRLALQYAPGISLTVSTQANICNYESAAFYRDLGAARLVLARELSLDEIAEIHDKTEIELEIFIHGAMCMAYSGRCLLSHYLTGRSANRGACAHPCRYHYALQEEKRPGQFFPLEEDDRGSYILNSRDLCLLEYLPSLMDLGIDAFKVEGRMKSPLYVASAASIYRSAIDAYQESGRAFPPDQREAWLTELRLTATRPFTDGFMEPPVSDMQDWDKADSDIRAEFCGIIRGFVAQERLLEVEQRANFGPGDSLEILVPGGSIIRLDLQLLLNEEMQVIDRARHARQRVFLPYYEPLPEYSILRRVERQHA